jgi:integrase
MFNWALKPQYAYFTGVNPASGHKAFPEVQRDRFLQPHEVRPFFEALAAEPNTTIRDCLEMALLTGARTANVQAMRWSELDLDQAIWRVKGEESKNSDPQTIPLVEEAVAILRARQKSTASVFVFPSPKSKSGHITSTSKAWMRILQRAGLSDIVKHDLRRTLGSWQARTGASLVLIGKSLNHRDPQSTKIYARLDLDPVRQSVTRATNAMFEAAGVKPTATVIPLHSPADGQEEPKSAA